MTEVTANYDEPWKEAIGEYFDYFLEFFFPQVYTLIDWCQKPISLEQELQKIIADSDDSKRAVDKLFKVWLKDSSEIWVLVHIEVQSQSDKDFAQRMYIYNYSYNLGGCQVNLAFPTIKLLDYESRWAELESEQNPFAIMIMAHLKTKATTSNLSEREQWKWIFIRSLYEKGYQKKDIV